MPRSPSVPETARPSTLSIIERLRQMQDLGEIDIVNEGGFVISKDQSVSVGVQIQTLSDRITALEATLAVQSLRQAAGEQTDLTNLLRDLAATRQELNSLCNTLLGTED